MRKIILILTVIFATLFANEIYCQSNYVTIGSTNTIPYCIWKIQVIDEFNDAPLINARVEFFNYEDKIVTIRTGGQGIVVIIVYDVSKIQNSWNLRITDADYSYTKWKKEIKQYDYYSGNEKKVLVLRGIDWGNKNAYPTSSVIAKLVSSGKYDSWDPNGQRYNQNYNYGVKIPLYEFNVRLKYQHHPKEDLYINDSRTENYSNDNQNEKPIESSWIYKGKIHGCFEWVKGDIQILVGSAGKYLEDKKLYRAMVFNKNELIHYGEMRLLSEAKAEAEKLRKKF